MMANNGRWRTIGVAALASVAVQAQDLKLQADPAAGGALVQRLTAEQQAQSGWLLQAYRPSYILPVAYAPDLHSEPLEEVTGELPYELQDVEIKFQLSFMVPVWRNIGGSQNQLYAAYTQISLWQAYNGDASSPFRDTNYEPEMFLFHPMDLDLLGLKNCGVMFGAVHQSNGRGNDTLSRSWNRLYANFLFEKGDFAASFKPWYRIPESEDEDNNPDIHEYLGYGELRLAYRLGRQQVATMLRNNLDFDENRGAIQLDWTFPLTDRVKGYVQYFNGYGESLLNYQYRDERIGVGFLLNDWL